MYKHRIPGLLMMLVLVGVGGCASNGMKPVTWMNSYDVTMSRAMRDRSESLILVTMSNDLHRKLLQGGMVSRDDNLPPRYASFIADLTKRYKIRRVADWPLDTLEIRCLVFEAADPASRAATIAALSREPMVESAQALQSFKTMADTIPRRTWGSYNDPYLDMQHGFRRMQISDSHRYATGKGVRVAVIDTGVDTHHRDLQDRVVGTQNFIDRNRADFRADIHGTAVAGVIAAVANNAEGIVGVAPEAHILAIKACRQKTHGDSVAHCNSFALAKALNFAILQDVHIINLSLGGPPDPLLERLVNKALERDILVVGAADPDRAADFPAYIGGVIAVSESGARLRDASQSAWVKAPGAKVISAYPDNRYEFFSGSSLATAQIAGISALIRQRKPHLPGDAVQSLLNTTAETDTGAANGCRALARIVSGAKCAQ